MLCTGVLHGMQVFLSIFGRHLEPGRAKNLAWSGPWVVRARSLALLRDDVGLGVRATFRYENRNRLATSSRVVTK